MNEIDKFQELKGKLKKFAEVRDWSQFHDPKNLAISLNLEASEVLELYQWTKDNQIKEGSESELSEELADVLSFLLMLADHYNIDLLKALAKKIEKNELKYPVDKAKGNSKKYTEL